jgi:hypothetical protein
MLKDTFLNKLKENNLTHLEKYDYSLVPNEFTTTRYSNKIKIICPEHGIFEQNTRAHLAGADCRLCIRKRITDTAESFITKAKIKHANRYDYSKVIYKNSSTHVIIVCPKHGAFIQVPGAHLSGKGCAECGKEIMMSKLKSTNEEFISKAKSKHSDKYSYDLVDYKNNVKKITITCPDHGNFLQIPSDHLSGRGCPQCAKNSFAAKMKYTNQDFIEKANCKHNFKYAYNKVNYINDKIKVIISCPVRNHGDFSQVPNQHLHGQGCPKCRESFGERFISQILDNYKIDYKREYKINGYKYKYDFYLPKYDIYIEYHGRQHYHAIKYFGGVKALKYIKRNDKIKEELIKRSTGMLIVIKHTFNTFGKIEDEILRLISVIHPPFLSDLSTLGASVANSKIYLINNGIVYFRK